MRLPPRLVALALLGLGGAIVFVNALDAAGAMRLAPFMPQALAWWPWWRAVPARPNPRPRWAQADVPVPTVTVTHRRNRAPRTVRCRAASMPTHSAGRWRSRRSLGVFGDIEWSTVRPSLRRNRQGQNGARWPSRRSTTRTPDGVPHEAAASSGIRHDRQAYPTWEASA